MAKQNVTFLERHLEKFVIGVCGATLLAIVALYLIDTPNKVVVGNESLAPKSFYHVVEEEAGQAVNRMKNARPKDPTQNPQIANMTQNPSPYAGAGLPAEFGVVFVSPSPAIPNIPDLGEKEKVELAEVVVPIKPVLTTGRSTGKLPETEEVDIALEASKPLAKAQDALVPTKDYLWATVITAVNRKEQRELFEAKGYSSERLALVVADVEAEREELLPSGQWGEPEIIHSYAPTVYIPTPSVNIVQQDGEFIVPPDQLTLIENHHRKFASDTQQGDLLRPHFVDFLDERWRWTVKALPNVELDWADFNIELPKEDKGSRPGAVRAREDEAAKPVKNKPGAAAAAATPDEAIIKEILATMKEAEKAITEKKYLEAEEKLLSIKRHSASTSPQVVAQATKAEKRLEAVATEIEEAKIALAEKERRKQETAKFSFGPDIDPVWINDVGVTPGKFYRYRVRIIAINQYAGLPALLKNPEDAAKLVHQGKWSKWSDPIAVERDKHLFFTGIDGDNKSAKVEINQVVSGKWKSSGITRLAVGQPLTSGTGRSALNYNGIIVDIDQHRNYRSAKESTETPALVLVNSHGEVEEHLFIEDQARKKDFQKMKSEEERDRPAAQTPIPAQRAQPRPARPSANPRLKEEQRGS